MMSFETGNICSFKKTKNNLLSDKILSAIFFAIYMSQKCCYFKTRNIEKWAEDTIVP